MSDLPNLKIVSTVTRKHGVIFAEEWFRRSPGDAFDATGIVRWPDGRRAQLGYHAIEDEVCWQTFIATKDAIAEAFVRIAREVLARERAARRR